MKRQIAALVFGGCIGALLGIIAYNNNWLG